MTALKLLLGVSVPLLALLACAPREPAAAPSDSPLLPSVQATAGGGTVQFVLQVTNVSEGPVELHFPSGQSFDFVVRQGGREVWRWSGDRMFTQALRFETLAVGETRTYEASWTPPSGAEAEYVVTGVLTATDRRVEQSARFRLP
jgi:hypothetical protein